MFSYRFCHGLSSSFDKSSYRRQRIKKWDGSKRRRRRHCHHQSSTNTSSTSSHTNKSHCPRPGETLDQLQEETEKTNNEEEEEEEQKLQQNNYNNANKNNKNNYLCGRTEEKQLQTSLEEVPFEVIEAEDILLWGCPPLKIPRMTFSDQQQERMENEIFLENPASDSIPATTTSLYCGGSGLTLEKAASVLVYRKCQKFLSQSTTDSFGFEQWEEFFNDLISPSRTATSRKITLSNWCSVNPFETINIQLLSNNNHHNPFHYHQESLQRTAPLVRNIGGNVYHNIFAAQDLLDTLDVLGQVKCLPQHQLEHEPSPVKSSCQIFDIPSGDDKKVVVIQSTNKHRAFETSSIFESPIIIQEYSSDGEGVKVQQQQQKQSRPQSLNDSKNSDSNINCDKSRRRRSDNTKLDNIEIIEVKSTDSFATSSAALAQVQNFVQNQTIIRPSTGTNNTNNSDSGQISKRGHHQEKCHCQGQGLSLSRAQITTQILFQNQCHSEISNRTESIPSENDNNNYGDDRSQQQNNNNDNNNVQNEEIFEAKKFQLPKDVDFPGFDQFFNNVRMLNSLPTMYTTVYNLETDSECKLCRQTNDPQRHRQQRRRAASVAITQQCDFEEEQDGGRETLESKVKQSGNNYNADHKKSNNKKRESKTKAAYEVLEVFRMKPRDNEASVSGSKVRLANSSKCDDSLMIALTVKSPGINDKTSCRRRRSSSAPNSQTPSLISFSPKESFASSLELNPVALNILEENFQSGEENSDPPWNNHYEPGASDSMDGENFLHFGKFYPPPTPLSKKSSSKSSKQNTNNNNNITVSTFEENMETAFEIFNDQQNEYHSKSRTDNGKYQSSSSYKPCSNNIKQQKSILKNHINQPSATGGKESKSSSVKVKESSQKSILKNSKKGSSVKSGEETTAEDQLSENNTSFTANNINNNHPCFDNTSSASSISKTRQQKILKNPVNSKHRNSHHLKIKKSIRSKQVFKKSSKSKHKPIVSSSSDKLSAATTINNNVENDQGRSRNSNIDSNSKSKRCKEREIAEPGNDNNITKSADLQQVQEEEEEYQTKRVNNITANDNNLNNTDTKTKSRSRQKPPRFKAPSTKQCEENYTDDKNSNYYNKERSLDRQHNIKFRRKSTTEYPFARIKKCQQEPNIAEQYFRHRSKPHPTSSETTWGSTSLTMSNSYSSDDSSGHSRNTRRKAGRKKSTLWQKMSKIFFGCQRRNKDTQRNTTANTSLNVSPDQRSTSLFERIICWWRKTSHRKVIVRQDSLQIIRLKRQKWLREIHEFYEDVNAVCRNPRVTERSRSRKSRRKSTPRFEKIPAKIVNSEGCILLRDQTALLDAQNGNRPKEKGGSGKPLKGILKKSIPSKPRSFKPSKHINYKYS